MDCTGPAVFTAVFLKNDHGYAGYLAELPGVTSHGRTIEQARESLRHLVASQGGDVEPGMAEQTADCRVPATS